MAGDRRIGWIRCSCRAEYDGEGKDGSIFWLEDVRGRQNDTWIAASELDHRTIVVSGEMVVGIQRVNADRHGVADFERPSEVGFIATVRHHEVSHGFCVDHVPQTARQNQQSAA